MWRDSKLHRDVVVQIRCEWLWKDEEMLLGHLNDCIETLNSKQKDCCPGAEN